MITRSEKETQLAHERYIKSKRKYYIWLWCQRAKGRSFITADMRWFKLFKMKKTAKEEERKEREQKKLFDYEQLESLEEDEIMVVKGKKLKDQNFAGLENSFPYCLFISFLNRYFTHTDKDGMITDLSQVDCLSFQDLDTMIKCVLFDDKCSFAVTQLQDLKNTCTKQRLGFFHSSLRSFFTDEIQDTHALRANALKAIGMSLIRPELNTQTYGTKLTLECGRRQYKFDLFPSKCVRKAKEQIEEDYDRKLEERLESLTTVLGLLKFRGIDSLDLQNSRVRALMKAVKQPLRQVHLLLSLEQNQFFMQPTFKVPNIGDRVAWRAYNMIIGKRGRQTFTFETTEEQYQVEVEDDIIGKFMKSYLELQKRRRKELDEEQVLAPKVLMRSRFQKAPPTKLNSRRSKPIKQFIPARTTRSKTIKEKKKLSDEFANRCPLGCQEPDAEQYCSKCILNGRIQKYTIDQIPYHLPPGCGGGIYGQEYWF